MMNANVTRADEENFVHGLAKAYTNHLDWLVLIRYGLKTLLDNQPFLMELIALEAERLAVEGGREHLKPSDCMRTILEELGLRLVIAD
jgi:hypothetical protein